MTTDPGWRVGRSPSVHLGVAPDAAWLGTVRRMDPGLVDAVTHPQRLVGLEAGLDFARELDDRARYSLTGEVSGVHFTSGAPDQLLGTVGASVAPSDAIELSVVALGGLLAGSDRYGFLLGVSPHFRVW